MKRGLLAWGLVFFGVVALAIAGERSAPAYANTSPTLTAMEKGRAEESLLSPGLAVHTSEGGWVGRLAFIADYLLGDAAAPASGEAAEYMASTVFD